MNAPDSITILTTKGPLATKRITWSPEMSKPQFQGYDSAKHFSVTECSVANIHDLTDALETISRSPTSFIVRGKPAEGIDRTNALRRSHSRPQDDGTAEAATLEPAARHWIALDLDSIPCPDSIDPIHDPDEVIEHVVEHLPEEFHGATCYWQFTSGHGLKPGIRVRLFFWSDRPLEDWELKQWLGNYPIDLSIFQPAQPIYVARPIFVGRHDPVPVRSGLWKGDRDEITPPVITKPEPQKSAGGNSTAPAEGAGLGYEGNKARIGDHEGGAGFYQPIMSAIGAYFARHGAAADAEWLRADLEQIIRERGHTRDAAYVETRVADLDGAIRSIQDRQAASEALRAQAAQEARCEPYFPDNGVSLDEGGRLAQQATTRYLAQLRRWHGWEGERIEPREPEPCTVMDVTLPTPQSEPPVMTLIATLGLGKTRLLADVAAACPKDACINVLVPNHALGKEVTDRLNDAVATATAIDDAAEAVERAVGGQRRVLRIYGREMTVDGERMCEEYALAKQVQELGQSVENHLCQRKRSDGQMEYCWNHPENPSRAGRCRYQRQNADQEPAIRVAPNSYLPVPKDASPLPEPHLTIIDEDPTDALIRDGGTSVHLADIDNMHFLINGKKPEWKPGKQKLAEAADEDDLRSIKAYSVALREVLEHPNPTPARLREAGLDAGKCRWMKGVWYEQIEPLNVTPSMARSKKEAGIATYRAQIAFKLARLWGLIADVIDLPLDELRPVRVLEQEDGLVAQMVWAVDPKIGGPMLICDGTADDEILHRFWPNAEIVRITVTAEHYHATQVVDRAVGKTMLGYNLEKILKNPRPDEERRSRNHRAKLAWLAEVEASKVQQPDDKGHRVYLSTYKSVAEAIRDEHPRLADLGVSTGLQRDDGKWFGHLGATAGLNHWEHTPTQIIAGRLESVR